MEQYDQGLLYLKFCWHVKQTCWNFRVGIVPYLSYLDRQAWANSVDPEKTLQNAASHQGLPCLPLIQPLLDTTMGSKLYLFEFKNKCGKKLMGLKTYGKYGI